MNKIGSIVTKWGQELVRKAGDNQFAVNASAKRVIPSALIPGQRQLGIADIMATGGTNGIRDIATDYWFGPLQPINPTAPSTYRPRQWQYTPGANLIWTPKGESAISFETLRALADSWDLLRIAIETQKDRICKKKLLVRAKKDELERRKDWEQRNATDPVVKGLTKFLECPDGFHDFPTWLRMWMEDMMVCDAVALYNERDLSGKIASVHPIAGDTINRLLTDQGITPPPPSPAYQQVVYGTPACELTTDDLTYYMRNERTNRRYGYSPVEQILITISIGLRRQEFQLQYYTSGNMPEALCFLPGDIPSSKVKEYQDFFDAMLAGDLSKRRRLTFLPGFGTDGKAQSTVQFTKDTLLKDEMDEWLARVVCMCIGISPTPFTKQANRAQAEQMQETSEEEGMQPYLKSAVSIINNLIQSKMGLIGYEVMEEEEQELDILKAAQADNLIVGKIIAVNEARKRRGMDAYDDPRADMLGTFAPAIGFIPLGSVGNALTEDTPQPPGADEGSKDDPAKDDPSKQGNVSVTPDSKNKSSGKPNGTGKSNGKGKPSDAASKLLKAGFRQGSLHHIQAGVLTHTSQDAKTALEQLLTRKFHAMRNHTAQAVYKQVNKTLSVRLAKMDVTSLAEFERATVGKTRYSVNHLFDKPIQLRRPGTRPYGKVKEIYEKELRLELLTPTQYWLKPEVVIDYATMGENPAKGQEAGKPVDVVRSGSDWLLSDGHHRAAADRLAGSVTIAARVFPRWATDEEIHSAKKGYRAGGLAKVDDYVDITQEIMDELQQFFTALVSDVEPLLQQAALSGLTQGVLAIDVNDTSLLTDVNDAARNWAAERAAEMVGMEYDAQGNLVANSDARWAITNSTRDKIQSIVTDAFSAPSTVSDVGELIDGSGIFDAARAAMIARTEISRAQLYGNMQLWEQSGVVQTYNWLLSEDNPCDECQEFADNGPYTIGEGPLPIDDSHPNCECIIAADEVADQTEQGE